MNAYFLSKGGTGESEGPLFEGRLLDMWKAGALSPTDLLCLHGTEDWVNAGEVMASIETEIETVETQRRKDSQKTGYREQSKIPWGLGFIFGLGVITGLILLLVMDWYYGLLMLLVCGVVALLASRRDWTCSICGNSISSKSTICPNCHSKLITLKQWKKKYRS